MMARFKSPIPYKRKKYSIRTIRGRKVKVDWSGTHGAWIRVNSKIGRQIIKKRPKRR